MKLIACCFFFFICFTISNAQELTITVDSYTGDTTISTGFDTLSMGKQNSIIPDRVVGVRSKHKGESKYWLFFYFSTSDIPSKGVKISSKNFAYFIQTNNEYIRLPYTGRAGNYSDKDNAGFFIDITNYISRLQFAKIKMIRFETSTLYHEIVLPEKNMLSIANIVNKLTD